MSANTFDHEIVHHKVKKVADTLDAWAEAHHAAAMTSSDADYSRMQRNMRDNYQQLARTLRETLPK